MSQGERPPPLHVVVEAARIAALHSYPTADSAPEEPFDTLVRLAAHLAHAPVAMMSLMGRDQQDLKAAFGSDIRQIPRSVALCNHTLAEPLGVMVIPDTLADARFQGHPMVAMPPSIRFYAGVCLTDGDGYALGTLCVMDTRPASITAETLAALRKLAQDAIDAMALRRAEQGAWQNGTVIDWPANPPQRHPRPPAPAPVAPGWLGVRTEHTRVPGSNGEGRLLITVAPGSPADRANMQAGDIILTIDGRAIRRRTDITSAVASCTAGVMRLQVWRDGGTFECTLQTAPMPEITPQRRWAW